MILGAIRVGVNWRYSPAEMAHVFANSSLKVCVLQEECIPLLAAVLDEEPVRTCTLVGLGRGHGLPHDYERLLAAHDGAVQDFRVAPEDPLLHSYTSGVTGSPKAVILSHRAIEAELQTIPGYFGLAGNDVWYMPAQSAWVAIVANIFSLMNGMTSVMPDGAFELNAWVDDVERLRVSKALLVPAMMSRLVASEHLRRRDLSSLRRVVYGSGPSTPTLIRAFDAAFGVEMVQLYGMTECVAWSCFLQPDEHRRALGGEPHLLMAAGRFGSHVDWKICDDEGREMPRGESGTIWLRTEALMSGYLNLPDETREVLLPDGWYITNDIGRVDEQGFLYLLDRRKFLINSGGVKSFPAQVEAVLARIPGVADVMVVGVPHPEWGKAVVAAVVSPLEEAVIRAEIAEYCRHHLSRLEAPKHIEIMEELPRTTNGKADKHVLINFFKRKELWASSALPA
jgi:acyl-CoA synthetase (AMP-forming)/AMP-acid ligase II